MQELREAHLDSTEINEGEFEGLENRSLQTVMHWGTYNPVVQNGNLTKMPGYGIDPDPSQIATNFIDGYAHASRVKQPSIRKGFYENGTTSDTYGRGREPFIAVPWEQAEQIVADVLRKTKDNHGNEAIYAGSYGWASPGKFHHAPSQLHRFLNCFGGFTYSKNSYSFAAAEVIVGRVLGHFHGLLANCTSWPSISENTDLMVAFGGMPLKNGQIEFGGTARHVQKDFMSRANSSGVKFVSVSPIKDDSENSLDFEWLPIVPNTDVAMMLGIAYHIVANNLHDQEFLDTYCVGFEKFKDYLMGITDGQPKSPAWAASICGISSSTIASLALRMTSGRTMISVSWSLTRQEHGEQPYWMAIVLAAMIGQIGLPGGGVGFGYSATNGVGNHVGRVRWQTVPTGTNPVSSFIPVSRIADLLLNPGGQFDYDGESLTYPDIKVVYWAGGNPFHHHQDLNRLIEAWRKPECIVIHDSHWTSAAKYSDIVLPATTLLERSDISASPRDSFVIRMDQIMPPYAEAKHDYRIFQSISKLLGTEETFTEGRTEEQWHEYLYEVSKERASQFGSNYPDYHKFVQDGIIKAPPPKNPVVMLSPFRDNPSDFALKTPSGKIEIFSETIDSFNYDNCAGHPTWMEPSEWLGNENRRFNQLHLISNQPLPRLHSQLDCGRFSQKCKVNGREPVRLNSSDAANRQIENYDTVMVYNERGAFYATAVIDDNVSQGVLQVATGAWFDPVDPQVDGSPCKHGNPNVVTHDRGTSKLAQGPAAMSCLVEIEKATQDVPEVSAFNPPKFESAQ